MVGFRRWLPIFFSMNASCRCIKPIRHAISKFQYKIPEQFTVPKQLYA